MRRPAASSEDFVPTPAEFAGWPPLGRTSGTLRVGPVSIALTGLDARASEACARWAGPSFAPAGAEGEVAVEIEILRCDRAAFVDQPPGSTARVLVRREGAALAMTSQHAALLFDPSTRRGLALLAAVPDEPALDRALQNLARVAVSWALVASGRGLLLHASAVLDGDGAVVFVGPSGAGKTTALGLSTPRTALADDVAVVARSDAGPWQAYPSPLWAESSRRRPSAERGPAPVAAWLELAHERAASATPLSRSRGAALLAGHVPFFRGLAEDARVLDLAADAAASAACARLGFARNESFWPALSPLVAGASRSVRQEH